MSRLCFHKHHKLASSSTTNLPDTTYSKNDESNEVHASTSSSNNCIYQVRLILSATIILKLVER